MQITEKKKKYTAEDYMLLEEGAPFQLINYDLVMSPSPTPFHQSVSQRLTLIFGIFLDNRDDQGYFGYAPLDIKFDDGNILQPDIIYITAERKNEMVKDIISGAPDIAFEILSPSSAYYDLRQKKDTYEKYGVKEYIIVDPIAMNAELYALKDGAYYLHQKAEKTESLHSLILPGLSFDLQKVFK